MCTERYQSLLSLLEDVVDRKVHLENLSVFNWAFARLLLMQRSLPPLSTFSSTSLNRLMSLFCGALEDLAATFERGDVVVEDSKKSLAQLLQEHVPDKTDEEIEAEEVCLRATASSANFYAHVSDNADCCQVSILRARVFADCAT